MQGLFPLWRDEFHPWPTVWKPDPFAVRESLLLSFARQERQLFPGTTSVSPGPLLSAGGTRSNAAFLSSSPPALDPLSGGRIGAWFTTLLSASGFGHLAGHTSARCSWVCFLSTLLRLRPWDLQRPSVLGLNLTLGPLIPRCSVKSLWTPRESSPSVTSFSVPNQFRVLHFGTTALAE